MIKLFLAGDVMLGRGIDQILRHPGDPTLYESYARSALDYVRLAELAHGPIPRRQGLSYVLGEALNILKVEEPDLGLINLETAITDRGQPEAKGINYRMNPRNAPEFRCLGRICCMLANNHVLDWGREGLEQTLSVLHGSPISTAGAGRSREEACAPAIIPTLGGRVLVFGFATRDCGVPSYWAATSEQGGVNLIDMSDPKILPEVSARVLAMKRHNDVAVASIHWGTNWGHDIPRSHLDFAHALIDDAGIDLVHGHSSHHARGWELYRDKLIIYGCGDFVNDYEGISGYEEFRGDLALMYLATIDTTRGAAIARLKLYPLQIERFSLRRAALSDANWLCRMLNEQSRSAEARFLLDNDGTLLLESGHVNREVPQ